MVMAHYYVGEGYGGERELALRQMDEAWRKCILALHLLWWSTNAIFGNCPPVRKGEKRAYHVALQLIDLTDKIGGG